MSRLVNKTNKQLVKINPKLTFIFVLAVLKVRTKFFTFEDLITKNSYNKQLQPLIFNKNNIYKKFLKKITKNNSNLNEPLCAV